MHPINILLTLSSLNVLLVTIERFSFTTKILLPPHDFLRLHEVFQMNVIILFTVVIPFFLLYQVTNKFETLMGKYGLLLGVIFIIGIYFYSTGNGVHELASFFFNQYCDKNDTNTAICGGMFFNDYYFGNGLYFMGAFLMNLVLILFERIKPNATFSKKDHRVLVINSLIYAFAIFAYAAFDRVLVGLVYSVIMMLMAVYFFWQRKKSALEIPITYSLAITYTVGVIAAVIFRFH